VAKRNILGFSGRICGLKGRQFFKERWVLGLLHREENNLPFFPQMPLGISHRGGAHLRTFVVPLGWIHGRPGLADMQEGPPLQPLSFHSPRRTFSTGGWNTTRHQTSVHDTSVATSYRR